MGDGPGQELALQLLVPLEAAGRQHDAVRRKPHVLTFALGMQPNDASALSRQPSRAGLQHDLDTTIQAALEQPPDQGAAARQDALLAPLCEHVDREILRLDVCLVLEDRLLEREGDAQRAVAQAGAPLPKLRTTI